jgi:hypothetical protein
MKSSFEKLLIGMLLILKIPSPLSSLVTILGVQTEIPNEVRLHIISSEQKGNKSNHG